MNGDLDTDARSVRRAARVVSVQITVASCLLVLAIVVVAILVVIDQSRPEELLEPRDPGQSIYVDANEILTALVIAGVLAICFAGVVSWLIARRAVHPLGEALRVQRAFVADASHELRTPLAVLDARIQLLQHRAPPQSDVADGLGELRADSRALIEIVNDLLLAAGGDPGDPAAAPTDAIAAADSAVDALRVLADARDIRLVFKHGDAAPVRMPEASFRRCVTALVDNAIAHSNDGADVVVRVLVEGGHVTLRVVDHGSGIRGIPPSRIFDRFAHTDASAASSGVRRTGFGIGLALVRDLAVRHGGDVTVTDTSERGTTIVLRLPVAA